MVLSSLSVMVAAAGATVCRAGDVRTGGNERQRQRLGPVSRALAGWLAG